MLSQIFPNLLHLRIAQALISLLLVFLVLLLAYRSRISIAKEGVISILRGLVQIVAAGSLLLFVFQGPQATSIVVLIGMTIIGANIASRRAKGFPQAFHIALGSIIAGSASVLTLMTFVGVVSSKPTSMIPIGSMLIANAMITTALALERLRAEIESNIGYIETALALGASAKDAASPYIQTAVKASLIPRIDTMRSLGIVWIPGLMTGMLLAGSTPVQAALYQFVIVALILASGIISSLCCAILSRPQLFTDAEQLRRFPAQKT